jgi:hypothetical protein
MRPDLITGDGGIKSRLSRVDAIAQ